jgi:hypothetical protein
MKIRLPKLRVGRSEPLVVTGESGSGEIVYIKFPDEKHFQIGYDKWNFGGPISVPVICDDAMELELEISFGALYPLTDKSHKSDLGSHQNPTNQALVVRANGRVILNYLVESYSTSLRQIRFGENYIHASTCSERFTGEIIRIDRIGSIK